MNIPESNEKKPVHFEVNHRDAAIQVCSMWMNARRAVKPNALGLYRRSHLLQAVKALHAKVDAQFAGDLKDAHPDTRAAWQAVADWIEQSIGKESRYLGSIDHLCRFLWGYLERTAAYEQLYLARANDGEIAAAKPDEPTFQACMIGFAYGMPSLGALAHGTGLKHGLTRIRGRGRINTIGINNEFWSILAKNKQAHYLLELASGRITGKPDDITLDGTKLDLFGVKHGIQGGPQMIVQREGQPRMRLHLRFGKFRGSATSRKHFEAGLSDENARNPFHRIEDLVMENFVEGLNQDHRATEDRWGQYDHFCWCLEPVSATARRNSQLFK